MFTIKVVPDDITFTTVDNETILETGLKQKLNLPHSCKNGVCGACKCKVISGDIVLDPYNELTLSAAEAQIGYTLLCKAHAKSDVILDIPNLLTGFPIKMLPAKIESMIKINHTAIITLKLPANQKFDFYAGQYIEVMLKGKTRSYSLANRPNQSNQLELHVKYHQGGVFSESVWGELKQDSIIRFKGPLGTFRLQPTTNPIILVCTGTGFAPIKAIVEEMLFNKESREIHLYWGNRTVEDLYLRDELSHWVAQLNLKVTLCLSKSEDSNYFNGHVTKALRAHFTSLKAYEVYACGNPAMITDVYKLATQELHLIPQNFFSDAFIPSAV